MKFKNVTFKDVSEDVLNTFTVYFGKDVVSIGALVRKLPYLLMSLCNSSPKEWIVSVEYNPKNNSFESSIRSDRSIITVVNPDQNSKSMRTSFNILNKVFKEDKWILQEVTYGKVRFKTKSDIFIYEKTKWVSGDKPRYQFKIKRESTGVLNSIMRMFRDKSVEIISSEVLETSISPNVY